MIGEGRMQTKSEAFGVAGACKVHQHKHAKMSIFGLGLGHRDVLLASSSWKFERAF